MWVMAIVFLQRSTASPERALLDSIFEVRSSTLSVAMGKGPTVFLKTPSVSFWTAPCGSALVLSNCRGRVRRISLTNKEERLRLEFGDYVDAFAVIQCRWTVGETRPHLVSEAAMIGLWSALLTSRISLPRISSKWHASVHVSPPAPPTCLRCALGLTFADHCRA